MNMLVSFMTGNGEITLSESLREAVVAGVRAEFEAREQTLKETYAQEIEKITSDFKAQLAAKQNEINALKGMDDGDAPTTTMPGSSSESGMSLWNINVCCVVWRMEILTSPTISVNDRLEELRNTAITAILYAVQNQACVLLV